MLHGRGDDGRLGSDERLHLRSKCSDAAGRHLGWLQERRALFQLDPTGLSLPPCAADAIYVTEAHGGTAGCPCLADPPTAAFAMDDGMLSARPDGDAVVPYPASYGVGACAAHDIETPPYCADESGTPLPDAASWCASEWCWVDPNNCDVDADP
eukprot:SAG31_NODE_16545_length_705_cov_0.676568_1_plen_153_part_10